MSDYRYGLPAGVLDDRTQDLGRHSLLGVTSQLIPCEHVVVRLNQEAMCTGCQGGTTHRLHQSPGAGGV